MTSALQDAGFAGRGRWIQLETKGFEPIRSKAKNRVISEGGAHEAIMVDGKIFDNLNPDGQFPLNFIWDLVPTQSKTPIRIFDHPVGG
jgi:hypothetical protein